ncbi:hypothetical protein [Streptomyces sp. CC77]|uniref:hypothetical protein n=1 Tax=Streptomyces sp. CC77 TaxID=1906739 RepID=UPI0008DC879C|nr:hypothetical protein [Streptomyces sp. CC77]OII70038.1 hypothetical protein BJP39_15165 [Streptomyces sp. CC77]
MNQIGDKPEEVRRHREEEKRQAERKQGGGAAGSPDAERKRDRERVEHATPDEEAYSTFDAYEEPEDRP